jgi:hypothetical protein
VINMKALIFLLYFCTGLNVQAEQKSALGLLVELKDLSQSKVSSLEILTKKNFLKKIKEYQSLNILVFEKVDNNKTFELLKLCDEIKKNENVIRCEIDYKIPNNNEINGNQCISQSSLPLSRPVNLSVEKILKQMKCELLPSTDSPHQQKGLTTYWAQEYTGADLARKRIAKEHNKAIVPDNLVEIWDSEKNNHAEHVSNLIMGPNDSSLIQKEKRFPILNLQKTSDYLNNYEKMIKKCIDKKNCPQYINNSMDWLGSDIIRNQISKISKTTVFVTSAGNTGNWMDKSKRRASADGIIIAVANLGFTGLAHDNTSFASEVTISAPAGSSITSFNNKNEKIKFSGTSAATPEVTAALSAFTLITGHSLTTSEAKKLLQQTALPFPFYPDSTRVGSGILNSFKIIKIAERIKEECQNDPRVDCVSQELSKNQIYATTQDEGKTLDLLYKAMAIFPECNNKKLQPNVSETSCEDKRKVFDELREIAFLTPERSELWSAIACISEKNEMEVNAKFYNGLAERSHKNNTSLISDLLKLHNPLYVVRYIASNPQWNDESKLYEELIKNGSEDIDFELASDIFSTDDWNHDPAPIRNLIQKSTVDIHLIEHVLSKPRWAKHTDLVESLIMKNQFYIDSEIDNRILSSPIWREAFNKKFGKEENTPIDSSIIRSYLSSM